MADSQDSADRELTGSVDPAPKTERPGLTGAASDSSEAPKPRKVYESTLLPDRRRRISPWLFVPVVLAVAGLGAYLMVNSKKVRVVNTVGSIAVAMKSSNGTSRVWIGKTDQTPFTAITPETVDADSPAFSADGNQIAFVENRDGVRQIFLMDADGKEPIQVTTGGSSKISPSFVPSDRLHVAYLSGGILFTSRTDSGETDRILPPADLKHKADTNSDQTTSSPTSGLPTVVSYAFSPATDPADQHLSAVEDVNGTQILAFIPSLSADAITTRTQNGVDVPILAGTPVTFNWAPDGKSLWATGPTQSAQKVTASPLVPFSPGGEISGKAIPLVAQTPIKFEDPVTSPNGNLIVVTAWLEPNIADRRPVGLGIVPSNGSSPVHPIFNGPAENVQFTQDGQWILCLVKRKDGGHDLMKVDINGAAPPVRLSDGTQDVTGFAVSQQTVAEK